MALSWGYSPAAPNKASAPIESPSPPTCATPGWASRKRSAALNVRGGLPAQAVGLAAALAVAAEVQRQHAVAALLQHERIREQRLARIAGSVEQEDDRAIGGRGVPARQGHAIAGQQADRCETRRRSADTFPAGKHCKYRDCRREADVYGNHQNHQENRQSA